MSLLRNGIIYSISNALSAGVPFLLLPVLTRALSPSEYGMVINFFLLVSLSSALAGLGVHGAVGVKWFSRQDRDFPRFVGSAVFVALLSTLLCCLLLLILATLLDINIALPARLWVMAGLCAGSTTLIGLRAALWQSQGKAIHASLLQLFNACTNVTFSLVGVFFFQLGGEGRILGATSASSVSAIAATILLLVTRQARITMALADIRELTRFGLPLIPHTLAGALLITADKIAVSTQLGVTAIGIYGAAAQIGAAMNLLADAMVKTFSPWMYEQLTSKLPNSNLKIVGATYLMIPIWFALALGIWLVFRVTGTFILGARYAGAIDLSLWFLLGGAVSAIYLSIAGLFFFTSRTEWLSVATLTSGCLGLGVAIMLTQHFGVRGGGAAFLATQTISLLATWYLSTKIFPMPWGTPRLAVRAFLTK